MSDARLIACRDWIVAAVPSLTDVINLYQSEAMAPRPAKPYAAIGWLTDISLSATPYRRTTDTETGTPPENEFREEQYMRRRRTLHTRFYGDGSWDRAADLLLSIRVPAVQDIFRAAEIEVVLLSDPQDGTDLLDTTWEEMVMTDFGVLYMSENAYDVPVIEQVDYSFNGVSGSVDLTP